MPNPWDRPPIPSRGDTCHEDVYLGVGRVTSKWEAVEFELSRLHTWFGGKLDDPDLMSEYGKGTIFRTRAEAIAKKAAQFFQRAPSQKSEGRFSELLTSAHGFADRRNEIAHGISFRIDRITFFREQLKPPLLKRQHFALVPPLYAIRWADDAGFPGFAYTSVEMMRITRRLEVLLVALNDYREEWTR